MKNFGQFGESDSDRDGDGDDAPASNGTPAGHANSVPMDAPTWPGSCPMPAGKGSGMGGGKY